MMKNLILINFIFLFAVKSLMAIETKSFFCKFKQGVDFLDFKLTIQDKQMAQMQFYFFQDLPDDKIWDGIHLSDLDSNDYYFFDFATLALATSGSQLYNLKIEKSALDLDLLKPSIEVILVNDTQEVTKMQCESFK